MTLDELRAIHSEGMLPFDAGLEAIKHGAGWRLQEAAVLKISGPDRLDWLQGQVSNDVLGLSNGEHCRCCVLSATGQIVADCQLICHEDDVVLIADGPVRERLIKRLESTIILEDVVIEDLSDSALVHVAGPSATGEFPNARLKSGGFDSLGTVPLGALPVSDQAWERARIEDGYPVFGNDLDEKTLAMEMGPSFVASRISFSKGCYTGQEIVERISARGHTNRQWVRLDAKSPLSVGGAIEGGGKVTSSAGLVAAGFVRIEAISKGEVVVITGSGGVMAAVTEV